MTQLKEESNKIGTILISFPHDTVMYDLQIIENMNTRDVNMAEIDILMFSKSVYFIPNFYKFWINSYFQKTIQSFHVEASNQVEHVNELYNIYFIIIYITHSLSGSFSFSLLIIKRLEIFVVIIILIVDFLFLYLSPYLRLHTYIAICQSTL